MKKRQKISLRVVFVVSISIIVASLMYSCGKTYDIQEAPSSVAWSEDFKDQIEAIRQSENIDVAQENLERNNFPKRALSEIPEKADELNLAWADKAKSLNLELALFRADDKLNLLDESQDKEFKAKLSGFEPGFIVKYNSDFHHYLLESFNKVLNNEDLQLLSVKDYNKKQEKNKVINSVDFSSSVYPCSVYDNIHYWITFAKEYDIKLKGHGEFYDKEWRNILYEEAQDHLDIGYIIALNLPDDSRYIEMESGKEFIETPEKKMAVNLP